MNFDMNPKLTDDKKLIDLLSSQDPLFTLHSILY